MRHTRSASATLQRLIVLHRHCGRENFKLANGGKELIDLAYVSSLALGAVVSFSGTQF